MNNNNLNLNEMLNILSKMDKNELEEKIKQAQTIMKSKNINPNTLNNNSKN